MNSKFERTVLVDVLKKLDTNDESILDRWWMTPLVWLLGGAAIFALFELAKTGTISIALVVIGAVIVGIGIGFYVSLQIKNAHWPLVKPHLNRTSVKNRLDEIGT